MKKFTLFLVFLIVASTAFSQFKLSKCVWVPLASTKLGTNLSAGDRVYCAATGNEYILTASQGGSATVTSIISGGYYTLFTTYSATPTLTTLSVSGLATLAWTHVTHSLTTNDSCTNLVASTSAKAPTISVATTLNLPGTSNAITKTTGNANSVTVSHSVSITDTSRPGTLAVTNNATVGGTFRVTGYTTWDALPSHTIACGTLTIPTAATGNDTTGRAVVGLTTSAVIIASYAPSTKALATVASDTAASAFCIAAGWLTVAGKHGRAVNYWIPKK